jgi:hypothetical protein
MKNAVESLLEHDHASLDQLLTELDAALTKPANAYAFGLLDLFWARLAVHIRAENLYLFPALENAPAPLFTGEGSLPTSEEAHNVLARLRSDHDFFMKELARMIKAMRESRIGAMAPETVVYLQHSLMGIIKRLEGHNLLEEKCAYVWPGLIFDGERIAELSDRIRGELERLPPRFT